VIGDVMGKGLDAAVFTSELRFILRGFVYEHKQPGRVLRQINSYLCESHRLYYEGLNDQGDDAPVCLALTVIEAATGRGVVSAAGMAAPLLIRSENRMEEIDATGLPLGIFLDARYDELAFELESGETLILTTDGIIEARRGREFLDTDGLRRLAHEGLPKGTLEALGRTILDGARAFAGGKLQDDACLLLIRRR
jgi:serine phosphatase RsbU (regulator of sigma subunit)